MDTSVILFTMWTESIKHFAENSQGNVIFLDGSTDAMQQTMKEMMSLNLLHNDKVKTKFIETFKSFTLTLSLCKRFKLIISFMVCCMASVDPSRNITLPCEFRRNV